ncbi:MAG: hypothetical protein EOM63_04990 [Clostridia bacterium]|nr:hypothetical protein [Clostridia bacterium]
MTFLSQLSPLFQPETLRRLLTPSDLIILGICILCFAYGCYRGLLRTVFGFVQGVAAFTLAGFTARVCAPYVADYLVMPIVGDALQKKAQTALSGALGAQGAGMSALGGLSGLLNTDLVAAAAHPLQTAAGQAARSMAQSLSYTLLFFILMTVFGTLLHTLFRTLKLLTKIGPIGALNRFGGGLLGLAGALLLILLIFAVLSAFSPATFSDLGTLSPAAREKTLLTRSLYDLIVPYLPTA